MSGDDNFLSRWSRRKLEARRGAPGEDAPKPEPAPVASTPAAQVAAPDAAPEPVALPPIESLTPESDFTPFMKPEVEPSLRTQALKTLFRDPHFNVMDGLDVYIDDYSKPDPIPEGWLEKMTQVARLGAYEPPREEPPPEAGTPPQQAAVPSEAKADAPGAEAPAAPENVPPSGTSDRS